MAEPFKKLTQLFPSEEERDKAYSRKLERDFLIASGARKIKKVYRRRGNESLYGYEVTRT